MRCNALGIVTDHLRRHTVLDSLDHSDALAFQFGQFLAMGARGIYLPATQAVQMRGAFLSGEGTQLPVHQLALQCIQNVFF